MTNGTFDNGVASGWTTDNTTAFAADSANHGSPANAANSVKVAAGTADAHLFSPKIDVTTGTSYTVNAYANITARTAGEMGYYIDEYDAAGNWVSGQWKKALTTVGSGDTSITYIPSNANVKKASLQVYVTANSGIAGYVDNVQWMAPAGSTTTPPPVVVPPTNLVANNSFDNGIADGWTTTAPANVTADTTNGDPASTPAASVKMVGSTANVHLFSPQIAVDSTKNYSLTSYINLQQITAGELGYYIDEYDAAGNWISGQWKAAVTTVGGHDVAVSYTPSSANVKKASLQVYVTANSGITAFVDNVRWYQN
jgi:hypothetical protein